MPLGNEPVYAGEQLAGQVTSAAYGYRVGRPVALAYVDVNIMSETDAVVVELDIAGKRASGIVSLHAAYDPEGKQMKQGNTMVVGA